MGSLLWQVRRRATPGVWQMSSLAVAVAVVACSTTPSPRAPSTSRSAVAAAKSSSSAAPPAMPATPVVLRPAAGTLKRLLAQEDTDGNRRITTEDTGPRAFDVPLADGGSYRVAGVYPLANLVQELTLAGEGQPLELARLVEHPLDRTSRLIRQRYWDGLTRRLGGDDLTAVLADDKVRPAPGRRYSARDLAGCFHGPLTDAPLHFLWVPAGDPAAFARYRAQAAGTASVAVCRLPRRVTPRFVRSLDGDGTRPPRHGLLALASKDGADLPYVVPGGRFNELYGWDSYFHVLGLLADGKDDLAVAVVEHLLYEVQHYGKVLNANRTYYLTRSQPPLLAAAIEAVWRARGGRLGRAWLQRAVGLAVREYRFVWNTGDRRTRLCEADVCLGRYHGSGIGEPPEVEPGHFDWLYEREVRRSGEQLGFQDPEELRRRYRARQLPVVVLDRLDAAFEHDRCMRESGHDTTYRWFDTGTGEDRCADFAPVGLNALLLRAELTLARLLAQLPEGERPDRGKPTEWCQRARRRARLMDAHQWEGGAAVYLDVDLQRRRRHRYVAATTLYPLWATATPAGAPDVCSVALPADAERRRRLVAAALGALRAPGGLAASEATAARAARRILAARTGQPARELVRQWDYPHGWAPHQILAWAGLRGHGFTAEADDLTARWLSMIVGQVVRHHGTIPEKYDVVRRSHRVFAEYGNVGTRFSYITREGFGWMNASIQVGLQDLTPARRAALRVDLP